MFFIVTVNTYTYFCKNNSFFTPVPATECNHKSPVGTHLKIILIFLSVQAKFDGWEPFVLSEYLVLDN